MNVEPLTLKQVQERLDPGVTMLEYFVAADTVWLWVVEKDESSLSAPRFRGVILSPKSPLSETPFINLEKRRDSTRYRKSSHRLLIEPALPHIKGKELHHRPPRRASLFTVSSVARHRMVNT